MTRQSYSDDVWVIPIAADAYIREAWEAQQSRAASKGTSGDLMLRLAECLAASVTECLDPDLKPPTPAQIVYATDIARVLGLAIPPAAIRYRGAMAVFIESHVDGFNLKRRPRFLGTQRTMSCGSRKVRDSTQ
ncbi:hypothetical protein EAH75_04845 [Rhodanobacter glycinis]|nr:hypothetical protein EAH75_04845 [Rhodanobacter glycinis]